MADELHCQHCGAPLAQGGEKVVALRPPQGAGPPQAEVTDLGGGQVRLRINLVVPRETAVQVLGLLGEAD